MAKESWGFCPDQYCEHPHSETLLFDGICEECYNYREDEEEFTHQNQFDMYDDDFGQINYGRYMS